MSSPDQSTADETVDARATADADTGDEDVGEWFAASTLRIGLAIIGIFLLLFALGQAVGVPLLGMVADALATRVGRWLAVAVFALLLIVVAMRGVGTSTD